MIARLFGTAISLDLGNGRQRFRSPERLTRALAAYATPSGKRVAELGALGDAVLLRKLQGYRETARDVGRALANWSVTDGRSTAEMIELDSLAIADDDGWKQLLQRLARLGPEGRPFLRTALQRYLEYLNAAQDSIDVLRDGRGGGRSRRSPDAAPAVEADTWQHQSLNYNLDAIANAHPGGSAPDQGEFNRMPKGEPMEIEFAAHQSLSLLLARYPFVLVSGDPYLLIDEYGNDLHLRAGRNIVGRSPQCDVAVDTALRAVSRRHLIIEVDGTGPVRITDISTVGTFLPRGFLDNRLH